MKYLIKTLHFGITKKCIFLVPKVAKLNNINKKQYKICMNLHIVVMCVTNIYDRAK